MASRVIVPERQRDGVFAGKLKPKAAEGNNRRAALVDIGNLDTKRVGGDAGKQQQVTRPATRRFGAVLLANAQANAEKKNKKPVVVIADKTVVLKTKVSNPVAKKAVVKPKQEPVIGAGAEEAKKEKPNTQKSSRKKKVACGLSDNIVDIDAGDIDNQLAAVEYVEDLYNFYILAESSSQIPDYMDSQNQINAKMRMILVDWLIQVHNKFELAPETLYLTIYIVDRYLSTNVTQRRELQLLGISSMLIASKYEEIWAPEVKDFVCISDKTYTREHILGMEKSILAKLGWTLTVPTPYVFLVRFVKAAMADKEMENMAFFLAELGLMQYAVVMFRPSMLAASAVYAARCTLNKTPPWDKTLEIHTGYTGSQLIDCAKLLVSFHAGVADDKLRVVFNKYSSPKRSAVALLAPAKSLLAS
ncbi:G2/mitotic-specific cyclin S13-7-like isoform X2 [Papaver somniferum]|uniref:G2/mitotic-specific cyclin S13-7-like isoform X2 n=1 Tax=Papaver somniferum TaxID=3469 RepID=UPI000E701A2A|nr:G2/mitotic-specific cyclin S13-7-like isoform X2 [Papaver somniferum]